MSVKARVMETNPKLIEWVENHPEHAEFIAAMQQAQDAMQNHSDYSVSLDIMAGERKSGEVFFPYLTNKCKKPCIIVGYKYHTPIITVCDVTSIYMRDVEKVKVKTELIEEDDYYFVRYDINFKKHGVDYWCNLVISHR